MQNRWSDKEANEFIERYATQLGENLALRTYSARLLGADENLALHGGGNTSVKSIHTNVLYEKIPAIFVKASGHDMATIGPVGHTGLDLEYLRKLWQLSNLSDEDMLNEFRTHLFDYDAPTPSIEALMHAFLPPVYIDHTHADAILALTNQENGKKIVRDALGDDVIILDYVKPGFKLAKAASDAFDANPGAEAMVLMHHGLITWGETARESYDRMIELVTRAEQYLTKRTPITKKGKSTTPLNVAIERFGQIAPLVRGLLAVDSGNPDRPYNQVVLVPFINEDIIRFVDSDKAKEMALTSPLTSDHLIRTKALPLWVDNPQYDDAEKLKEQLASAVACYEKEYEAYIERNSSRIPKGVKPFDSKPRVVLIPGLGAICAGKDVKAALIARDITGHTMAVKRRIAAMGTYKGLSEEELFDMEYLPMQHAKLARSEPALAGQIAVVTGAAGAIGAGICRGLLENGCHVAITDLACERLDSLVDELKPAFGDRVVGVTLDVTDPESVKGGLREVIDTWGGLDITVICAGVAHVSMIAEMDLEAFQRLERINVDGTLLVLREIAPIYETQGTGGDVILVSTKNVFAPGAGFGAYSATKAASHQLGRIASLEFAELGVRVNMVSPDAVFGESDRKSGLWQEVGPDRMRARGLDEKGLEEYYRDRNLLKARVTAEHCANAVLFFATRQTPTTGATIPVDGGLPDATPR
jgi:rhamnulose-1-phosphate aldolase/alcohol dehydrogenase